LTRQAVCVLVKRRREVMGFFDSIARAIGGKVERLDTKEDLADFMDSRAAFLAQKCVVEFCRVRAGVYWQKLFSEAEFREKLTAGCWESYPPAMAMLAEMLEGAMRSAAGLRQRRLPDSLQAVVEGVFARHAVPAGAPEQFWTDAATLVRERLEATQTGAARPVREVAEPMARLIHKALPIHESLVSHDYDYIRNNLRMNLLRAHEDFLAASDLETLVADVLGR
jgi:hypothetical protein